MRSETLLALRYVDRHPDAAARSLRDLDPRDVVHFLQSVTPERRDALLRSMAPEAAAACIRALPVDARVAVVERMPLHLGALVVRKLARAERRGLFQALSTPRRRRLERALRQGERTAGGIADLDPPTAAEDDTADTALKRSHRRAPDVPYVYVIDRGQRLVGVVSKQALRRAADQTPVGDLMQARVARLLAFTPVAELPAHPGWLELDELPVVDAAGVLVGVLSHRDLRRQLEGSRQPGGPAPGATGAIEFAGAYCDLLARALVALTTAPTVSRAASTGGTSG